MDLTQKKYKMGNKERRLKNYSALCEKRADFGHDLKIVHPKKNKNNNNSYRSMTCQLGQPEWLSGKASDF